LGAEVAGTSKNVIALAAGIAAGCGFGANTNATVITRGLAETTRLALQLGADARPMAGLAGVGDLGATRARPLPRNRSCGQRPGAGAGREAAAEATKGQVAEGVVSWRTVQALARKAGGGRPITDAVVQVCDEDASPKEIINQRLGRTRKP